ncbi:MAG: hypothetical protein J6D11_05950 [Clostridia bacterium]|nr:hypothetical protein [Clostridia bacterium]
MKKRIFSFALALVVLLTALTSCGTPLDTFESFFVSVKKFDTVAMGECVDDGSADYFANISSCAGLLSEEQTEIAKTLFSYVEYTYNGEASADAKNYDIKLSYVDFASLIATVEESMAIGTGNASHYIKEIINSGNFEVRYIKKTDVTVVLSDEGKIILGHIGENAVLTRALGLDTFLRWYSAQR